MRVGFPEFCFCDEFAMMFLLVVVSGYFVWSGGLLRRGKWQGRVMKETAVSPVLNQEANMSSISAGDKIKESISISKLMVEVAKERMRTVEIH